MVNVYLEGKLGKLFGKKWELEVKSPTEALRAINSNVGGKLIQYLSTDGGKRFYKIAVQKKNNLLTKEEISGPTGSGDIYIIPTIRGSGDGVGMLIAGVALVALAVASGGAALAATGFLGGFAAPVAALGLSLVLGGITQLLTPTPKFDDKSADQLNKGSNIFQGNATTIAQGGAVPLIYGRVLVSPMPISASLSNRDQSTTSANVGTVEVTELPGGGYEYLPGESA